MLPKIMRTFLACAIKSISPSCFAITSQLCRLGSLSSKHVVRFYRACYRTSLCVHMLLKKAQSIYQCAHCLLFHSLRRNIRLRAYTNTRRAGHTRKISIPDCVDFEMTTNACRGFCVSYAVPSSEETINMNRNQVVTAVGQCCNIMETEDVRTLTALACVHSLSCYSVEPLRLRLQPANCSS